jgi:hypothetical protein
MAGGWGCIVFEALLEIAKTLRNDGTISAESWRAPYLLEWLRLTDDYRMQIISGMDAVLESGMVGADLARQRYVIHDWADYQRAPQAETKGRVAKTIPCPSCGGTLSERRGRDGSSFWGHGRVGNLGCRATVSGLDPAGQGPTFRPPPKE